MQCQNMFGKFDCCNFDVLDAPCSYYAQEN